MPKVKKELERMERLGVISPVTEPTDWCAGLVVVPKSGDQVHICVDMTKLNENVRRERQVLPLIEQTLGLLGGAQYFSKLDQIRQKQEDDAICRKLREFCEYGWPKRGDCLSALKPYTTISTELSVKDGLLMRGSRIIIPLELQQDILHRLHEGHQGITKCRLRAKVSVVATFVKAARRPNSKVSSMLQRATSEYGAPNSK